MKTVQSEFYQDGDINLLEYWRVLVKRKRLFLYIVGVAFVASLVIWALLPRRYSATTSLLPPPQEDSAGASVISHLSGTMGGLAGSLLGGKSHADLWIGILNSTTIKDAVIKKFDLPKYYGVATKEDAMKLLDKRLSIIKSKEEIISITVEDKDPKMAANIANAFASELDSFNKHSLMTSGRSMKIFVEERLKEVSEELARSEDRIRDFQVKNSAVQLTDQSKAIIEAIGTVKGQLTAKEVELQTFLSYASDNHPKAGILRSNIAELKKRLKELEGGRDGTGGDPKNDIFIPTRKIPVLAIEYARLLRNVKVQQTVYELLTQQYERARIQEARDTPTIQVLDEARPPLKREKTHGVLLVAFFTFTALFVSMCLAFFLEYIERIRLVELQGAQAARRTG